MSILGLLLIPVHGPLILITGLIACLIRIIVIGLAFSRLLSRLIPLILIQLLSNLAQLLGRLSHTESPFRRDLTRLLPLSLLTLLSLAILSLSRLTFLLTGLPLLSLLGLLTARLGQLARFA